MERTGNPGLPRPGVSGSSPLGSSPPDAERLLARFRASDDPDVLGALYELVAPVLLPQALAITRDPALAEDALHEAFLDLFRHAGRYDPQRPAVPWLAGIVRRKALKIRRREQRRVVPMRLLKPAEPTEPSRAEDVAGAIGALKGGYRSVARLRWLHGLTPQEIAALRGEAPGTTRSLLSRALVKLQRLLEISAALLVLVVTAPRWLWRARGAGSLAPAGAGTGVLPLALVGALGVGTAWLTLDSLFAAPPGVPDEATSAAGLSYRIHQARPKTPDLPTAR